MTSPALVARPGWRGDVPVDVWLDADWPTSGYRPRAITPADPWAAFARLLEVWQVALDGAARDLARWNAGDPVAARSVGAALVGFLTVRPARWIDQ